MLQKDKVKLTAGRVAEFECGLGKTQDILWDTEAPGFGLRATATKKERGKSYIFQAKLSGKTIRITIGNHQAWTLEEARAKARRLKVLIDEGKDPRQVKADAMAAAQAAKEEKAAAAAAAESEARRNAVTLADAWQKYLEYGKTARTKRNKKSGEIGWSAAHMLSHIELSSPGGQQRTRSREVTKSAPLASLMPLKLSELTGERLATWLKEETKTRPTAAALSFRLLRAFANWTKDVEEYKGLIPADAFNTREVKNTLPQQNAKKGDSLQREQLQSWFEQVRRISNPVISAYLQGLLLTGARRRELSALKWTDVDFAWRNLTIRDKVAGTRVIPLPPYLAHLLQALPRRNEWVFSSPTSHDGKITEPRYAHSAALNAAGLPHVSLHGLRRSFGTLSEWVEVPAGIVAQIMGHTASALAEKHYRDRPVDLLRMWHDKIEAWTLEQAAIQFDAQSAKPGLRAVAVT